uniref:Exostosin GT47 domain-containing protein n=1 Tax=Kalanchoe fedtschenkoi TaxID=63787 RepID=A0A7N0ZV60_KALFE
MPILKSIQFIELPNGMRVSSLFGSFNVLSAAKNASQVSDSSFESPLGGSGNSLATNQTDGAYSSTAKQEGKDSNASDERNGLGEPPSSNGKPVIDGASTISDGVELGESETEDKATGHVPKLSFHPSYAVVDIAPAPAPPDRKRTDEDGNAAQASPPVHTPSIEPPAEHIKNDPRTHPEINETPTRNEAAKPLPAVVSITRMNELLRQSRHSYRSAKPLWPSAADEDIISAKSEIENAPYVNDPKLHAPLYRNVSMFRRSYELMERILKVYVYREGKSPVFHRPPLQGIYASEGWFMKLMEANRKFVTKDPAKAHLFYFPFSSRQLEEALYVPGSHKKSNLIAFLEDYLTTIRGRYPYWNRTGGADHFAVACHDWAAYETRRVMPNSIRALCNSDVNEGFEFGKDVALPETKIRSPKNLLADIGGKPPSQRDTLAFFAGRMHGYLRPVLLRHWQDKEPDMKIFGKMPKVKRQPSYMEYMKRSKYCICPRGFEVNSPRVVEAIFFECVPVIISDNFVPPFFEILNWESFAVFVPEKDIPDLKTILLSIPNKRYVEMQQRVKKVQRHFLWHARPEKYDIFHMTLHSVWFNRIFSFR